MHELTNRKVSQKDSMDSSEDIEGKNAIVQWREEVEGGTPETR